MRINRRSLFQMIPFLGMVCKAETKAEAKQPPIKPPMSFEEELHKLMFDSPHLYHFMAGEMCRPVRIFFDGQEIQRICTEFVGDPHLNITVRGAVRVVTDFDRCIQEWKIGDVSWCPMDNDTNNITVNINAMDPKTMARCLRKNKKAITDIVKREMHR